MVFIAMSRTVGTWMASQTTPPAPRPSKASGTMVS
jgi:hypothetical protein